MGNKKIRCSFCGAEGHENDADFTKGVTGNYICESCIDVFAMLRDNKYDFLSDFDKESNDNNFEYKKQEKIITPAEIKAKLDEFVIGQDEAKKTLSIAAYNYYKRNDMQKNNKANFIEKSNILLIGPTGSGKTYLTETLAKILDVPFVSVDITSYSETGYKGNDPTDIIKKLYFKTYDINKTEHGIVFIDEIDKIAGSKNSNSSNVSDLKVQQGLLKLIEGTEVDIEDDEKCTQTINTKNILFICAGAFVGLDKIIAKRLNKGSGKIGFGSTIVEEAKVNDLLPSVLPEDLFAFGMTQEIIGRLHCITSLKELSKDDIKKIILEPKNSAFNQYKELFQYDGIKLEITDDAVEEIANICLNKKTGARGIRGILESTLKDASFELPSMVGIYSKCVITKEAVLGISKPKYVKARKKSNKTGGTK